MRCSGLLSGGAPVIKRFQVSATVSRLGIPLLVCADAEAGLNLPSTTSIADMVGINLDLATFATAQVAGGSPEALISVIINPDAILEIDMSGGAASLTAETQKTVTTGSTDGLTVTTGDTWTGTERDEGSIWGISGANAGQFRKITSTSATAATVTVAFAQDIAVGDLFGWMPVFPYTLQTLTLTTELDEFRQDVAVATNTADFRCLEVPVNEWVNGTSVYPKRPFARFLCGDHAFNRLS